jgi:hypothetical protein
MAKKQATIGDFDDLGLSLRDTRQRRGIGMSAMTDARIDARRAQVARLLLSNDPEIRYQKDIGKKLGVVQDTIKNDIMQLKKLWRASAVRDFDAERQRRLDELEVIKQEAIVAWEKSKADALMEIEEEDNQGNSKKVKKRKKQIGDPAYLKVVLSCIDKEVDLLQLKPNKSILEIRTPQDRLMELISEGKITFADLAGELGDEAAGVLTAKAKQLTAINSL